MISTSGPDKQEFFGTRQVVEQRCCTTKFGGQRSELTIPFER